MRIIQRIKNFDRIVRSISSEGIDYYTAAIDFIYCKIRFKIKADEYFYYRFYNYQNRYRKHFILEHHRNLYRRINAHAFTRSKYAFYQYIPDLFSREIILAPQCGENAFVHFLKKHKRIVIKPDDGSSGIGIEVITYSSDQVAKDFFSRISSENPIICEEFIQQHPVINQLNPSSVNTIRITSLLKDGNVEILSATLKCSINGNAITDNLSLGGIGAQIDICSGIVTTLGKDFKSNVYTHHPVSKMQIIGLQIPHWDSVISLVKEAHNRLPQCQIYGWDIAITETGVDIVEANSRPGCRIMQLVDGIPKGQLLLDILKNANLKKNDNIQNK